MIPPSDESDLNSSQSRYDFKTGYYFTAISDSSSAERVKRMKKPSVIF